MGAKLYITYDKRTLPDTTPSGYFMRTTVGTNTDPDELKPCLVIRRAMGGDDEQLVRIATLSDLDTYTTLPTLNRFISPELTGLVASDVIKITGGLPPLWEELGYAIPLSFTVLSFDEGNHRATITTTFPTYASGLYFEVWRTGAKILDEQTDGEANRANVDDHDYWLTSDHYDFFLEIDDADTRYEDCQAQAQSLVSAWDAEIFNGVSTELYE